MFGLASTATDSRGDPPFMKALFDFGTGQLLGRNYRDWFWQQFIATCKRRAKVKNGSETELMMPPLGINIIGYSNLVYNAKATVSRSFRYVSVPSPLGRLFLRYVPVLQAPVP